MPKEYIIYCDESETRGRVFSNFYGGVLVDSDNIDKVREAIAAKKIELNLFGEIKWSKFSVNYAQKYTDLIEFFFGFVESGAVKVRIMFTQNARRARHLTDEHLENEYTILYYFFIRHAFGLIHSPPQPHDVRVRVYPDTLPVSEMQAALFKSHVLALAERTEFRAKRLCFSPEDVTEVTSHDHDILQCLDVILGAMNFRLNQKHLDRKAGQRNRSPKTRAKAKLYSTINRRIRVIMHPHFNIGVTTGLWTGIENRWTHAYRHWNFQTSRRWDDDE